MLELDLVSPILPEASEVRMKAWWLGFPRLRCPHCGKVILGIKFVGRFKLPRIRKEKEVKDNEKVED